MFDLKVMGIAALLFALTVFILSKVVPDSVANAGGIFVLFMAMYPMNKKSADARGKQYGIGRYIAAAIVASAVGLGVYALIHRGF